MHKFEPFAPIDFLEKRKQSSQKDEKEILQEEIEELKRLNERLNQELQQLKFALASYQKRFEEEKKHLLDKINNLTLENNQLKTQLQELAQLYEQEKEKNKQISQLLDTLSQSFQNALKKLENKYIQISAEVLIKTLKELLLKDEFHQEESLKKLFQSILREKIFSGEISVRANPQDVPLLEELFKVKGINLFEINADPSLARGEFEIETDKFFIERNYDQLVREFVEELLREELKKYQDEEQTGH